MSYIHSYTKIMLTNLIVQGKEGFRKSLSVYLFLVSFLSDGDPYFVSEWIKVILF